MSFEFDTFAAEYKEAEGLFFKKVMEVLLRFKTSLHAKQWLRAKIKDDVLVIEIMVEGLWTNWNDAPLSARAEVLGEAMGVLAELNNQGHAMLRNVRRCKEALSPSPRPK